MTGGGVDAASNDGSVMNASRPVVDSGWFASVTNNSGSAKDYTFWAVCCRVPGQ